MAFFVRDCVRCGVRKINHVVIGDNAIGAYYEREVAGACGNCHRISIYEWEAPDGHISATKFDGNIEYNIQCLTDEAVRIATTVIELSEHIPDRIAGLFREANECRQMTWYEAAGSMYRKTLDVATKHIYTNDQRLEGKDPAQALRVRIKSLGEMKNLEDDIVELADIVALDGNDATHDVDPYTREEAEALEDLTFDLLERLFVRPARIAAVKAKQIAAGARKT